MSFEGGNAAYRRRKEPNTCEDCGLYSLVKVRPAILVGAGEANLCYNCHQERVNKATTAKATQVLHRRGG